MLGSPRLDELARYHLRKTAEREAVLAEFGLAPRRHLVVCAMPPDQIPAERPGCEFATYADIVRCWSSELAKLTNTNVIIVPHPRKWRGRARNCTARRGCRSRPGTSPWYIAVCDISTWPACTATIALAIACGTPVVNYDVYRYAYSDYLDVPGVLAVDIRADFERMLNRLTTDADFLADLQAKQQAVAGYWGLVDGRCGERLLREIDELRGREPDDDGAAAESCVTASSPGSIAKIEDGSMTPTATSSPTLRLGAKASPVPPPVPTTPAGPFEPPQTRFETLFEKPAFVDRYAQPGQTPVDVIMPIMHANQLWEQNLLSIYREIPVNRLILGDAGALDETFELARRFPRVEILDHRTFTSLGFSLRKMIEAVETEWFIYLHSDVFLPEGWFDTMCRYQGTYDWYECRQVVTSFFDHPLPDDETRATSGSQMGRKDAFARVLPAIDDDYLYRSEDIVLAELVKSQGGRYGCVKDTWHYHQNIPRRSEMTKFGRKVTVRYEVEATREERLRAAYMQARALVKYLQPTPIHVRHVKNNVNTMVSLGQTTWPEFHKWVADTNAVWSKHLVSGPLHYRWSQFKDLWTALMSAHYNFCRGVYLHVLKG